MQVDTYEGYFIPLPLIDTVWYMREKSKCALGGTSPSPSFFCSIANILQSSEHSGTATAAVSGIYLWKNESIRWIKT